MTDTAAERATESPAHQRSALAPNKGAAVYVLASFAQRVFAFALLPVYTRHLSPSQYGAISLILIVSTVATYVLSLGLDVALLRFFFQLGDDPRRQRRFVDSLWLTSASVAFVGTLVTAAVGALLISSQSVSGGDVALGLAGGGAWVAGTVVPLAYLRATGNIRAYVALTQVDALGTLVCMILFVVVLHLGIAGWMLAVLVANGVTAVMSLLIVKPRWPRPFESASVRAAVALGAPLVPHLVAQWSLLLADRAVLATITSVAEVGIYSLAANIATPALMFVQAVAQGFAPAYAAAGADGKTEGLRETTTQQVLIVLGGCLTLAMLGPDAIRLLMPREYASAAPLVPWLTLGFAFLGVYYTSVNGVSLVLGRTKALWPFSVVAAGVNIGLLYVVVPAHGLLAAAIASAVGYACLMIPVGIYARFLGSPARYAFGRVAVAVLICAVAYAAAALTASTPSWPGLLGRSCWVLLALICLTSAATKKSVFALASAASSRLTAWK